MISRTKLSRMGWPKVAGSSRSRSRPTEMRLQSESLEPRFALASTPSSLPALSIASSSAVEGDLTSTTMTFTVSLSAATSRGARASYTTVAGSAGDRGVDFYNASGVVYVRPNQTTAQIRIVVRGDTIIERNESFQIVLSQPVGCTITSSSATGMIIDNDANPVRPTVSQFTITTVFPDTSLSPTQQAVFADAARRWSEIITGDLPDVVIDRQAGIRIDDIEISATGPAIDGAGGTLGQAGPTEFRAGARGLPYRGFMEFDSADLAAMETAGTLKDVILHEMGHVLGLGSLWSNFSLVVGLETDAPTYRGTNGLREYNSLFNVRAVGVPVESEGGAGTAGVHWRESVFGAELMSGFAAPPGVTSPISRVTVGALQDLGYRVNYAAADRFTPPPAARAAAQQASASRRVPAAAAAATSAEAARQAAFLRWSGHEFFAGNVGGSVAAPKSGRPGVRVI